MSHITSLTLLFGGLILAFMLRRFVTYAFRRFVTGPPETQVSGAHCRCGYKLDHLDRIRCPECGRVFGFDATPEDLGLNDEELRKASEARQQRRRPPS